MTRARPVAFISSTRYLQAVLEPARALELVDLVEESFSDAELLQHLECVNFGGRAGFASLALLWPGRGTAAEGDAEPAAEGASGVPGAARGGPGGPAVEAME